MVLEQRSHFLSSEFKSFLRAASIDHIDAGIERCIAMAITERYHAYLRNLSERARRQHPGLDQGILLQLTVKTCNDTAGPAGMVSALLVFEVVPRMPIHPTELTM